MSSVLVTYLMDVSIFKASMRKKQCLLENCQTLQKDIAVVLGANSWENRSVYKMK